MGLVQVLSLLSLSLPFLPAVCALLHSRYSSDNFQGPAPAHQH